MGTAIIFHLCNTFLLAIAVGFIIGHYGHGDRQYRGEKRRRWEIGKNKVKTESWRYRGRDKKTSQSAVTTAGWQREGNRRNNKTDQTMWTKQLQHINRYRNTKGHWKAHGTNYYKI